MTDFDFWRCDECRTVLPAHIEQFTVRIQQQSERILASTFGGRDLMHRPVQTLVVCGTCHRRYMVERDRR